MRAFIAIDIPADIRNRISELIETLRTAGTTVRWARPESVHITLKFLGEIPAPKLD